MPQVVQLKRSSTPGSVPSSLADGEFAFNLADKILFYKDSVGAIVGLPLAALARIAWKAVGDAAYTILATDRSVALTAALTAARTWTLPAANAVPAGTTLRIIDTVGGLSVAFPLTLAAAGSDTLSGTASMVLATPYLDVSLTSDGTSRWTVGRVIASAADIVLGTDPGKTIAPKALAASLAYYALGNLTGTVGINFANGYNQTGTLTGNITLGQPTGGVDGQPFVLEAKQDATGSRTIAYNTTYIKVPATISLTLSTAANARDKIYGTVRVAAGTTTLDVEGFLKALP